MRQILANYTASISELKKSPLFIIENANGKAEAILNHNKPSVYLVPSELYEKMIEIIDDYYLSKEVQERLEDGQKPISVTIDDLLA